MEVRSSVTAAVRCPYGGAGVTSRVTECRSQCMQRSCRDHMGAGITWVQGPWGDRGHMGVGALEFRGNRVLSPPYLAPRHAVDSCVILWTV